MGSKKTPAPRENEIVMALRQLNELYPLCNLIEKSYVVSRVWAWVCRIETKPTLRVPVPRYFTRRDP